MRTVHKSVLRFHTQMLLHDRSLSRAREQRSALMTHTLTIFRNRNKSIWSQTPPTMTLFTSVTSLAIVAILVSVANAFDNPQTCNSNPECAALGLADNCCPTNLAGIFLDCCDNPGPSCKANVGCRDLVDDCCPAADGTYLYCCFDPDPADGGYKVR